MSKEKRSNRKKKDVSEKWKIFIFKEKSVEKSRMKVKRFDLKRKIKQ